MSRPNITVEHYRHRTQATLTVISHFSVLQPGMALQIQSFNCTMSVSPRMCWFSRGRCPVNRASPNRSSGARRGAGRDLAGHSRCAPGSEFFQGN